MWNVNTIQNTKKMIQLNYQSHIVWYKMMTIQNFKNSYHYEQI